VYQALAFLILGGVGFKVKILLNVDNPQVTKAFNSLVGTSEAIRSLSMEICKINNFLNIRSYILVNHPKYSGKNDKNWYE